MQFIIQKVRAHFFTGVLVLVPLAVIVWLGRAIFVWLWKLSKEVPLGLFQDSSAWSLQALSFIFTVVLLAVVISLLGWSSKLYFGQKILSFLGRLIQKIPLLGTIYSTLEQLVNTISSGGNQQFRRVVYVDWPRPGVKAIAFVTGEARGRNLEKGLLNLFIPTVPNFTSGFHMMVQESEVMDSNLTVEEAFKTILSFGIAQVEK